MKFADYLAARRTRLVEHAVTLGVAEESAPVLVDAVLADQRRRIERAADPDVRVYAALEAAVADAAGRPRRRTPLLVAGAAAVLVAAGGLVWWQQDPPEQVAVPSMFGYDATTAGAMLRKVGLEGGLETLPVCETRGQVLGSTPAAGSSVEVGSIVVLLSAVPPDDQCPGAADRKAAWAFVAFARGGEPPAFARNVTVIAAGGEPIVLGRDEAPEPAAWDGLLTKVRDVVATPARSGDRTPRLVVDAAVPPSRQCGVDRPASTGDREALRLQVQPDPDRVLPCPLTVDLYRTTGDTTTGTDADAVIDTVVVYGPDDGFTKWS